MNLELTSPPEPPRIQLLWAGCAFAVGLGLATIYELIARGTYDYDEFVYLLLGHAITRGRVPYRDFLFYHPPGIVVLMALLDPLVQHWWVWGRAISLLLDGGTCALVYLVARRLLSRGVAFIAVLLCASSPVMLTTGTRIMPDDYVMFFTFLAVYLLLVKPTWLFAVLAGVAFGLAIIFKYPAILVIPAGVLAAGKRRWTIFLAATAVTTLALIGPFLPNLHQFYEDTVVFQSSRNASPVGIRILGVLLYGLLLQPLGFFGLFVKPRRWWLMAGYVSGFAYVATTQVYYHYMAPIVPFAAILGAIYLSGLPRVTLRRLAPTVAAGAIVLTVVWSLIIEYSTGPQPFHITAAQAASVTPVSKYVRARTTATSEILDDRPDLPFLAYRANCQDYFWNDEAVITAQDLMPCIFKVQYIAHFFGGGTGFPPGFLERIQGRWCNQTVGSGANGAYVYDLHCNEPYLPTRN